MHALIQTLRRQGHPAGPLQRVLRARHPLRMLLAGEGVLVLLLAASAAVVWRAVPTEGVKLHGNVDTGIDLLGRRSDIAWIALAGAAAAIGNTLLALWLRRRERLASLFVLGTALLVLLGFIGALWFVFLLNRPL